MKNKLLSLLMFVVLGTASSFSQTVTLDSLFESRCQASGRAYFSVAPTSVTGFWSITTAPAGYIPNPPQSNGDFLALPAGSYVATYSDATVPVTINTPFVIAGTYLDPVFAVDTVIDAICPGQGEIRVFMTDGRLPYRYRLLHTDSVAGDYTPWQASGDFNMLRAGTYEVQAEDSCGVLKTISNIVVDYPFGGPLGYNYNGAGDIYTSDEATTFPTSCTEATITMMLRRNYLYQSQQASNMQDGNGANVADHTDPNQVPLSLTGGMAPYSYSLTQSEAYSFFPPLTDALNDLRPDSPYTSSSSTSSSTYFGLGRGITFDVANDLTIYSVGLIGGRTGYNVKIVLYDNAGNEVFSKWEEQDVTNGNDNVASLGWFIPAGTGYRLTIDAVELGAGRPESHFFSTGVPYPISAGDITITGNAATGTDARVLSFFSSVVYSQSTTPIATNPTATFANIPRTNANSYTIVGEDACGEKVFRSVTTRIPLEYVSMRRTAAECGIGNDRLFPDRSPYTNLHYDVAQHYYTWPWRGNSIGGTLPYTYTVTSDIGYSPDPITTDLGMANATNAGTYYDPQRLRNLDGSQWQPIPGSTVTVNITDACGESITEVFGPPTGNIPVDSMTLVNDIEGCAPWRRVRIGHFPFVDTFENFIMNINPLTAGAAHARVVVGGSVDYFTPEYNYYQGWSLRGNEYVYPYFLPGDYEVTFTGVCSGNIVRDTMTVTPSNFSFVATPIQPCSSTPTGLIVTDHSGSELYTSPIDLLFAGSYDPTINYATAVPLDQSNISGNVSTFSGLAPGTYTVLHGSTNASYGFLMNCAEYQTVTILPYKDPVLSLTYDPSCATPTGNIYAAVTDGVPPYTYQWKLSTDPVSVYTTNSQSSSTITGLAPAIYNVRVIDSCGQSTVRTVNTAAPFAIPPLTSNGPAICVGSQLRINATYFPNASYDWRLGGVSLGATDTNIFELNNMTAADAGTYDVVITLAGCASPAPPSIAITVPVSTNNATAVATPDRMCEGDGPINLTGGNTTMPTITAGTWSQVSGPTSPLTSTITPNNVNISVVTDISNTDGPPEDPYVFRWEINNGTCTSNAFDTVYIHRNPPSAYSGFDQELCEQTTATMAATVIPFGFGYWTQVSGNPVTITDTTDPASTITGLVWPDTVVMQWNVVNDSANATCTTFDQISIINKIQPIASTANAGMDDTACGTPSYTLQARPIPTDSGTGKWVAVSFPGLAPAISGAGLLPNSVATLTSPGIYTFAWEVSNGVCATVADTVEIFYIAADAGNDVIVCMDDTVGIMMGAVAVPGIDGTWTSASPTFTFTPNGAPGSESATIGGFVDGTHVFTYTVSAGTCTQTDNVTLLASNPPSISDAGMDQLGLCQDTAILQANIPVDGRGVWTQISGPNAAIMTDFDSAFNIIEGLTIGSYEFVWTISNQPCTPEVDTVLIEVTALPPSALIVSYTDPTCVLGGTILVNGVPAAGSYEYSIDSSTGGYQALPTFAGLDTGSYQAWVRDLTNLACVSRPSATVFLVDTLPGPTFDTAYFTPVSTCNGVTTRGSITVGTTGGNGTITYNLTGSFTASNTTGVFTNLLAGIYTVKATDSLNCPIDLITDLWLPENTCDTLYRGIPSTGGTDSTCIPTTGTGGPYDIGSCDGTDGTYNGFLLSFNDSCVTYTPPLLPFTGDTACIIICDTIMSSDTNAPMSVIVCDTTTIIYYPTPMPDTIVTVLPQDGSSVVVCADTSDLLGSTFSYTPCGGPSSGTFSRTSGNCYTYIPLINNIDTACVIVCDELGICDTTYFVFIPPLTNDTVVTTNPITCVDTTEMPAGFHTITGCDGNAPTTTSNGGTATIDPLTGCVTTTPDFTSSNADTTCIIVCDTVLGICDTTIIITVQPPTPDTIIQLTNGLPTDTCLSTDELIGSMLTYSSCGAPSNGVLTNTDTCYNYIPILNQLDTACVIICDEYGICDTTVLIYVPPVTNDTVFTFDPIVCVDTTEMPAGFHTITGCDGNAPTTTSNGGTVTIDPLTGCVTTTPDFTSSNADTTCIIVCDTVLGICDTTYIITFNPPTRDTIIQLTNGMPTDSCISTSELVGTMFTYSSCGAPINGVLTNLDSCYTYTPINDVLDTACIVICDEYGLCDTTILIYVPPVTPDTVVTTNPITCVDTTEMPAGFHTITGCDGNAPTTTSNGGTATIDPLTGCVTTTPDFTSSNADTTCIIVCDTVLGICDTTIIVTVQPPTPDTIVQLTNGMPTDSCLSTDELVGSMFTYTSCGAPIHGVLTNLDSCYTYTPINNMLDTACVIICDEYGICDTTYFIYVPPVTPDTIYALDTVVCVDTTEMPNGFDVATGCDGNNPTTTNNGGAVTIDAQGCVTVTPVFAPGSISDTTCIIICDTVFGLCDTTIIITVRRAMPDTIVECIPRDGEANDSAMNTNDLLGSTFTTSTFVLPQHGQFTLTDDTNSSYQTSPFPVLDTVEVSICDEYGFCDTFTFIYIPPMTNDTIFNVGGGVVCVDTTEMPANQYQVITTCDRTNTTSNGGTVVPQAGACVDITPDFTSSNVDTTCIILCDTILPMCECDTTIIISFRPTIPDTFAIQLPKGTNTADTCLTTSELFGTMYTYRRLGGPTPHGPVTTHNDTCINYVQTSTTKYLDTARVLICDEYGVCDTTIIIYVPTPDPDTMYVGPVIPVTNADTCVRLESTYMTGMHVGTCDASGTSSGGVPVTITGICVRYPVPAPVFTGDSVCIIVCDTIRNITICDTTLIVYLPDTTPPTVICKDDTVYLNNLGTVMIDTSNVLDTVYDNTLVNAVWLTPTTFNCSNVGPNNVTVYARDTNRNIDSCISIVTVLDTVPPTAICQNITIQLDSNGNASIMAINVDGGSFDNCAIASMVVDQTSFDCSHIGQNTVILTVTDIYGNSSTCSAIVTVEDNIAPIAYCPGDKQTVVRNTTCEYIVEDFVGEASAWDNCSRDEVTITQTPAAGTAVILENASQVITITATDASGNASTCTFNVYARCVKELNIPQFVSPDGNGQNDTWEIPELANYPNNVVKVFNRWGNLVFEEKGYVGGWNASSNQDNGVNRLLDNKMLPEGTYFYIIDLGEGDFEPYVGYLQIKR